MTDTAVIVVDMQNDYCHPDGASAQSGHPLPDSARLVGEVQRIVVGARAAGALVVFVQMTQRERAVESPAWLESRDAFGVGDLCLPGTWGHAVVDGLDPREDDLVIEKSRFSSFFQTRLYDELTDRGIRHCIFTGVTTNGCVDLSLRDAYQWGFRVTGVSDASGAFDQSLHEAALRNWARRYGDVKSVEQVLADF